MSHQQAPLFNRRPTPVELAEMESQAKAFALEIAALFDPKALPIPVVLKSLLLCYQALAVHLPERDMRTATQFLGSAAATLTRRADQAAPNNLHH